jgi:hypothetical protein
MTPKTLTIAADELEPDDEFKDGGYVIAVRVQSEGLALVTAEVQLPDGGVQEQRFEKDEVGSWPALKIKRGARIVAAHRKAEAARRPEPEEESEQ